MLKTKIFQYNLSLWHILNFFPAVLVSSIPGYSPLEFLAKKIQTVLKRVGCGLWVWLLLSCVVLSPLASAQQPTFTQGYAADTTLQKGMIVRLEENGGTKVVPLSAENIDKMYGVVVDPNDAPLTISGEKENVFVANNGRFEVLVSDQNGMINIGDYITISAINGVGMKASPGENLVAGRALADFGDSSQQVGSAELKDEAGGTREVKLGRISVDINVSRNPLFRNEANLPEVLRKASEAIAGKPVDATRVYLGLAVLTLSTVVSGSLIYAGVRNAIISIGRNPLSKKLILKGMARVVVVSITIFIIGLFGVYLLLKL